MRPPSDGASRPPSFPAAPATTNQEQVSLLSDNAPKLSTKTHLLVLESLKSWGASCMRVISNRSYSNSEGRKKGCVLCAGVACLLGVCSPAHWECTHQQRGGVLTSTLGVYSSAEGGVCSPAHWECTHHQRGGCTHQHTGSVLTSTLGLYSEPWRY